MIVFTSCDHLGSSATLYKVTKSEYHNQVIASGYLEASNSVNIVCPSLRSDVTVLYLLPEGSYVHVGDTVCVLDAPEIQTWYNNAKKDLEIAEADYKKTSENLNLQYLLLEAQVRTIEATSKITRLDSLQQEHVSDLQKKIIALEIEKSRIEKEKIENKLKFLKQINDSELRKMELKIQQSQNRLNFSGDLLKKLYLTTPVEGIVQYAYNRQTGRNISEGDIVWRNKPILNIPDMTKMQAHIVVNENYYKRISPKQKVEMQVDAFPELSLKGEIKRKSPVGRQIKKGNQVKVFDIFASVDSVNHGLHPGLSLTCKIKIEELKDTIFVPLTSIFENDSLYFVYLKTKKDFKKQTVKIGSQSSTHAIILEGLKENDEISLINPYQ